MDQSATAADVTTLQVFRDLFSSEVFRPGEEISIGSTTLMFTDLRNSTKLYREIGDAQAFSHVREHFDILERAIAAEEGPCIAVNLNEHLDYFGSQLISHHVYRGFQWAEK